MKIEGRVVAEGHRGVPGLMVHVLEQRGADPVQRLGSVSTDDSGAFVLDLAGSPAKEPTTLWLSISAAADASGREAVLVTTAARTSPGARETFLIQLDGKTLAGAKVALPSGLPHGIAEPSAVVFRAARVAERRSQIARGVADAAAPYVARELAQLHAREAQVTTLLHRDLGFDRHAASPFVVGTTDTVREVHRARLRERITQHETSMRRRATLSITEAQLDQLRIAPGSAELEPSAVERALQGDGDPDRDGISRSRVDLLGSLCRQAETAIPGGAGDEPSGTPPVVPMPLLTMSESLARLTDAAGRGVVQLGQRGTPATVRATIDGLELRGGPADVAAVHDFSILTLALDDVWQQILDPDLVENASEVCEELSQAGVDLTAVLARAAPLATNLRRAAHAVLAAGALPDEATAVDEVDRADVDLGRSLRRIRTRDTEIARDGRRNDDAQKKGDDGPRSGGARRLQQLIDELTTRLGEPHQFQVFATDGDDRAVNFGLAITYRQRWEPLTYQAGPLVRTITLAPSEERTFSVKHSIKRTDAAVRGVQSEAADRTETTDTVRDVSDIVNAAKTSLGFQAEGRFEADFKLGSAGGSTTISRDSERSSQETRQSFREGGRKAAQEQKEARKVEITTTDSVEDSREETGKITNPNTELPVTYLFYELERRYRVSEQLHRIAPVVLVAQEVPAPNQITRAWLVQHDWILVRALRDDSFRAALRYLLEEAPGAEVRLHHLELNMLTQRELVAELKAQIHGFQSDAEARYTALEREMIQRAAIIRNEDGEGFLSKSTQFLLGGDDSPEAARVREDMARDAYERSVKFERDARDRLTGASSALATATAIYVEARARFENAELGVLRLRVHVKQNILHYMQAIWDHEPRDQRVFRLQSTPVPRLAGQLQYRLVPDPDAVAVPPLWLPPFRVEASMEIVDVDATVLLAEVADLDRPLGYRGNYMMFALRTHNTLTRFLSLPYADSRSQIRDPDDLGNFSISALDAYVTSLHEQLSAEAFEALRPQIVALYTAILARPYPDQEEIVLPSHSLYLEALPGTAPVLEDFQLLHRAVDTARITAEVRIKDLESLRLIARLQAGELGDPDVQTMIVAPIGTPVVVGGGGETP